MDEDIRTVWCGNLSEKVTEEILYELFLQGGPVQKVSIPRDRDGKQRAYGFVTYKHINSVSYAMRLFDGTSLFNRKLNISARNNQDAQPAETAVLEHPIQLNELLLLGDQMLLGYNGHPFQMDAAYDSRTAWQGGKHHSSRDDRRPRAHPYYREQKTRHDSDYNRDYSHRSSHDSQRHNDYGRHGHRSGNSRHNRY